MGSKTKVKKVKLWGALATLRATQRRDRKEFRSGIKRLNEATETLIESNRLGTLAQVNHLHRLISQKKSLDDLYKAIETWEKKLQAVVKSGQKAALEATGREWAINRIAKKLQALDNDLTWRVLNLETWAGKRPVDPETGQELEYPCPYCGSLGIGHICEAKKEMVGLDSQPAKTTGDTNVMVHEKDEEQDYEKIIEENRYKEEEMSEREDTQWLDDLLEMLAEPASRPDMMRRLDVLYASGCTCTPERRSGPNDPLCHSCYAGETLKRIRHQYIRDMCNLPTGGKNTSFTAVMEAVDRLEHKFKRNLALGRNADQAVEATAPSPEAGYTTSETDADAPVRYAPTLEEDAA